MRYVVFGGAGFIGSHMTDLLVSKGHEVTVVDNLLSGYLDNVNPHAKFVAADIRNLNSILPLVEGADGVFNYAAIARTPWCIEDPILCHETNVTGTLNILEACRRKGIKRVVLSSSNVVYAFETPYRASKLMDELYAEVYNKMYGQSVVCLRYSNVYGPRQSEEGPSPNVFAALRKSKKEKGKLIITGDGEQSRDYTHVSDIGRGGLMAMESDHKGVVDLCTGRNVSLNLVAKFFDCPIEYIEERPGDVKHIVQDPKPAFDILGWKSQVEIEDGIKDVL